MERIFLGDVCTLEYGKSLPQKIRKDGTVPVYGSNGLVGYHDKPLTNGPTIVIGRKGSIGKVNFSKVSAWPIDTTYFVNLKNDFVDLDWLCYLLSNLGLENLNKSSAVPGLNRNDAYRKSILLPPLEDQKRIVKILDQADALRQKRKQAIALLDEYVKSVFLEMFGDPVSNPKGWKKVSLGQLGKLDRGVSKHRPRNAPELLGGDHPLIQTGDVSKCDFYINKYHSSYSNIGLRQSKKWPKGTLCITIAANIAKTGILGFEACFPDSVVGFIPDDDKTNNEFIHYWFSFFQKILEESAPESAQKNINLKILRELKVALPPFELQADFCRSLRKIEFIKESMLQQSQELETQFQALIQKAFKGKL